MDEYIEREALLKDLELLADYQRGERQQGILGVCTTIRNRPAADVVEVVRCKDCKHRYVPTRCALWYATVDDKEYFVERGDDFYCSYGEAKMDGKGDGE